MTKGEWKHVIGDNDLSEHLIITDHLCSSIHFHFTGLSTLFLTNQECSNVFRQIRVCLFYYLLELFYFILFLWIIFILLSPGIQSYLSSVYENILKSWLHHCPLVTRIGLRSSELSHITWHFSFRVQSFYGETSYFILFLLRYNWHITLVLGESISIWCLYILQNDHNKSGRHPSPHIFANFFIGWDLLRSTFLATFKYTM